MTVQVGTSGWQYADWRGGFYPESMPQRRWLEHYAVNFACVEVNNTFYRLPTEDVFAQWRQRTPPGFHLALKLSRYISHIRRLHDTAASMAMFLDRAAPLGDRLGPLLLQLPPTLEVDVARLGDTLAAIPGRYRIAVEVRHPSWFRGDVMDLLARRDAALCLTDRQGMPQEPLRATASWGYLRFHRGSASSWSYAEPDLRAWASRLLELWGVDAEVYAFFNNDSHCAAVGDAVAFARLCTAAGLAVSRVPTAEAVHLT